MISKRVALRLALQMDHTNNSIKTSDFATAEQFKTTVSEKSFLYGVKPGVEFRILENSKISPYCGIEFSYRNMSSNSKYVGYISEWDPNTGETFYTESVTKVDGAWREIETIYVDYGYGPVLYNIISYTKEREFNSYGSNIFFGADFFFIRNMYVGFELGLAYEIINYKKIDVDISTEDEVQTLPSSKSSDFGFYYNNSIRLGVWF